MTPGYCTAPFFCMAIPNSCWPVGVCMLAVPTQPVCTLTARKCSTMTTKQFISKTYNLLSKCCRFPQHCEHSTAHKHWPLRWLSDRSRSSCASSSSLYPALHTLKAAAANILFCCQCETLPLSHEADVMLTDLMCGSGQKNCLLDIERNECVDTAEV